jgi:2-methylcitrate dehydratase PrpD
MEYDQSGGEVKRLHAGAASRSGVQAALLAARGFTGPLTVIEGLRGLYRLFAAEADPEIEQFWAKDFSILDTFFKLRPAVGTVHAPLDAVTLLQREHGFTAEDIVSIDVGVAPYAVAHGAAISRPEDMIGAQFSLAFSMGLLLARGATRLQDYADPAAWHDPAVLAVADKVRAYATEFAPGAPPLGARVKVALTDGRVLEHYQYAFRGHAENPASDTDIETKFRGLVAGLLADPDAMIDRVARLDRLETVAGLVAAG